MWEDDFNEDDFEEDDEFEDVFDDTTWYVYDNMSEELENKVELEEIEKVFLYEKQFLDESKKLLEFGVQSGEEFEEDMVYYVQRKMSSELILTIEDITEILRLEEAYYLKNKSIEFEYSSEYYYEKAIELHYEKKDYKEAESFYTKALELTTCWDEVMINSIEVSLEKLRIDRALEESTIVYKNEDVFYLKSLESETSEARYSASNAKFYIEKNKLEIAQAYIDKALSSAEGEKKPSILAEVLFYCFANFYYDYPFAKKDLEILMAFDVVCEDCNFSLNIQIAKEDNHPEFDKVIEFAERLTSI